MRRTIALELVNWADQHEKGIAAKILVMDAMSSKESCYRDNDSGDSSRVKKNTLSEDLSGKAGE